MYTGSEERFNNDCNVVNIAYIFFLHCEWHGTLTNLFQKF